MQGKDNINTEGRDSSPEHLKYEILSIGYGRDDIPRYPVMLTEGQIKLLHQIPINDSKEFKENFCRAFMLILTDMDNDLEARDKVPLMMLHYLSNTMDKLIEESVDRV